MPPTISGARKSTRKPQPELADTPIVHSKVPNALKEQAEQARPVRSRKRRRLGSPSRTGDSSAIQISGSCQALSEGPSKSSRCSLRDWGQTHAEQPAFSQRAVDQETKASDIRRPDEIYSDEIELMSHHSFSVGSRENDGSFGASGEARVSTAGTTPASLKLQISSLPILDNLATQIMEIFLQHTLPDLLVFSIGRECQMRQTFVTLNNLFCQIKKVYAEDRGFFPLFGTDLTEASQIKTIRNANTATFFSNIFNGESVDFQALLDYFPDTIVPEDSDFKDEHSELLVELLTQACISEIGKSQGLCSEKLTKYFCVNLLPSRLDCGNSQGRIDAKREHTKRLSSRRNALLQVMQSENNAAFLRQQFPWDAFLGLWHTYLQTKLRAPNGQDNLQKTASHIAKPLRNTRQHQSLEDMQQTQNQTFAALPMMSSSGPSGTHSCATTDNIIKRVARAAQFTIENYGDHSKEKPNCQALSQGLPHKEHLKMDQRFSVPGPPIQFHFEYGLHPEVAVADSSDPSDGSFQEQWPLTANGERSLDCMYDEEDIIPYPTQSAPTRILYERARMASASKSALHTPRKAPLSCTIQRRPWTSEEEHALMAGLDRVKGPHWSQIHAMFGPSGNVNRSLKDRSQVQMKDKARNLKLFFLKSNTEVPYYLQFVTGELKTRAPSRALKHETNENGAKDEDRAHVSGVMTFAGSAAQKDMHQTDEPLLNRRLLGEPSHNDDAFRETGLTPDDNIDPSLGALSPPSGDHRAGDALHARVPYHVPTPNMIMQNLDRCTQVFQK